MGFDPDELHELTGVPEPPPTTTTPPRFFGLGDPATGPDQHDRRSQRIALVLLLPSLVYILTRFQEIPGRWWAKLLVLGVLAGIIVGFRRAAPRVRAAHFERVRERSRRDLVRQRSRHVPDGAISTATPQTDEALDRGISRSS